MIYWCDIFYIYFILQFLHHVDKLFIKKMIWKIFMIILLYQDDISVSYIILI